MHKTLFILFILSVTLIFPARAQTTTESPGAHNRIVIKLNYSNVNSRQIVPAYTNQPITLEERFYEKNSQYGIEGLYKWNRFMTAGLYFSYSKGTFISNEMEDSRTGYSSFTMDYFGRSYFYGGKGELQLLPLLFKADRFRFNVYCPIRVGLVSQSITEFQTNTDKWDAPVVEFGGGLGSGYNFTKNIGIYTEYQLGHFYNKRNSQWKAGLVLAF